MTFMQLARLFHAFDWRLAPGETCIDFSELKESYFMAKPLHACATSRLPWLLEQIWKISEHIDKKVQTYGYFWITLAHRTNIKRKLENKMRKGRQIYGYTIFTFVGKKNLREMSYYSKLPPYQCNTSLSGMWIAKLLDTLHSRISLNK